MITAEMKLLSNIPAINDRLAQTRHEQGRQLDCPVVNRLQSGCHVIDTIGQQSGTSGLQPVACYLCPQCPRSASESSALQVSSLATCAQRWIWPQLKQPNVLGTGSGRCLQMRKPQHQGRPIRPQGQPMRAMIGDAWQPVAIWQCPPNRE
jgi:hypothetical protein